MRGAGSRNSHSDGEERNDEPMVIDSGIENADLTTTVNEALSGEASTISSDVVSEGLAETITETALPIIPVGVVLAILGLPLL